MSEELIRIGEKIISTRKIQDCIGKIMKLRSSGLSQQDAANVLHLDRTFISRLESIGEVRKGKKIAVFGFPLDNKEQIKTISEEKGVDYVWLMDEEERWDLVKGKSAIEFFNQVMDLITELQVYDIVILIGSKRWLKIGEALLNNELVFLELGESPITEDCSLNLDIFRETLDKVIPGKVK
ncbi:MAG: transcriptional regulator [Bacillota bacterium]|nr:transcriptional regulator [Bacillota bacterium]